VTLLGSMFLVPKVRARPEGQVRVPSNCCYCLAVFLSPYGRILSLWGIVERGSVLDLPNAALGLLFYVFLLLFPSFPLSNKIKASVMVFACLLSVLLSVYLGYSLFVILSDVCLVCVSSYVVNAALLVLTVWDWVGAISGKDKVL
jgi:vitamin-K-epoxide reductase (warfarin-sensitive)